MLFLNEYFISLRAISFKIPIILVLFIQCILFEKRSHSGIMQFRFHSIGSINRNELDVLPNALHYPINSILCQWHVCMTTISALGLELLTQQGETLSKKLNSFGATPNGGVVAINVAQNVSHSGQVCRI